MVCVHFIGECTLSCLQPSHKHPTPFRFFSEKPSFTNDPFTGSRPLRNVESRAVDLEESSPRIFSLRVACYVISMFDVTYSRTIGAHHCTRVFCPAGV